MLLQFFKRVYRKLRRFLISDEVVLLNHLYQYDKKRFSRFVLRNRQLDEAELADICVHYHTLEKGFTMPGRHMPFGENVVRALLERMRRVEGHLSDSLVFTHTVAVLKRYRIMHQEEGAWELLSSSTRQELDSLLGSYPDIQADELHAVSRDDYYASNAAPFPQFSASRHSVRDLCGEVSLQQIEQAVSLARNAPSACNRQHVRIHCICDKEVQKAALELQSGNRGFGHLADKLLIVTVDIRDACWIMERNDLYLNAGIFLMNLCYALHYHKVAHCILNWFVAPWQDEQLRRVIDIPDYELVACMIACGDCPEHFLLAHSPRKPLEEILTVHR